MNLTMHACGTSGWGMKVQNVSLASKTFLLCHQLSFQMRWDARSSTQLVDIVLVVMVQEGLHCGVAVWSVL